MKRDEVIKKVEDRGIHVVVSTFVCQGHYTVMTMYVEAKSLCTGYPAHG